MTMQKNQQLRALPNVLREQTVPNTLRGMRQEPASGRRASLPALPALPIRTIAIAAGVAVALALVLLGRAS